MKRKSLFYRILEVMILHPECFHPDRKFYKNTGIGQRRYGLLYRGDKAPTEEEIRSFCDYIGCSKADLFMARQLEINYPENATIR